MSTPRSLDQIPLEVLHIIFFYIDIPDILRIRRVSWDLNQATHYRIVWANAYHTSNLVRPPGPFPSQSADDLERVLNTSLRIHRNVSYDGDITNSERLALRVREIQCPKIPRKGPAKCLFGRFLLVPFSEEVHYYDLHQDESLGSRIIFRRIDGIPKSFYCVSAIDVKGHPFACLVLSEAVQTMNRISIYLLKLGEQSKLTSDLIHQFERANFSVCEVNLGPRVVIIRGALGQFPNTVPSLVALDVHTRVELHFDASIDPTWEAVKPFQQVRVFLACISTSTHVVLALSTNTKGAIHSLFRVFALPDPAHHPMTMTAPTTLRPSHYGIIPRGADFLIGGNMLLLHDSLSDPFTQDMLIAIKLGTIRSLRRDLSPCGTLRLSAMRTPSDDGVGTITFQPHGPYTGHGNTYLLKPSYNGTGRTFYIGNAGLMRAVEYDLDIRGEREVNAVDYPVLQFSRTSPALLDYDPFSGQVCLALGTHDDTVLEIWDFSVCV